MTSFEGDRYGCRDELEMRATGHATKNAFVAARMKKRSRDVREQNSRPVFSGLRHGGAEKKFNRTGGTAGKNPCGWLGSAGGGDGRFDTAASNPAPSSAERSHQAGGCDCRGKPSFIHDLFYPFYRRLEFVCC